MATQGRQSSEELDVGGAVLQAMQRYEENRKTVSKPFFIGSIVVIIFLLVASIVTTTFFVRTLNDMRATYIRETENIIRTRSDIELANSWERLPVNQRKERLREKYYEIIRYYTVNIPEEQKMSDEQILASFNQLWLTTERVGSMNFFLPVAYMKVASNFNPLYNQDFKRGIGAMYLRTAEQVANLPLIRTDPTFMTVYNGAVTINNPAQAINLLIARIDDLMKTFNDREDWVLLALFTDEYQVIRDYWDGGQGEIPDELYERGSLAEALNYYYAFKNWQVPAIPTTNE